MLAVVLATLAEFVVVLKLRLRNISKRIISIIFLNIYTPLQHALIHIILCFEIIDKVNSKFDLKIKEALYINWRKPNLNAQQNNLALALSLWLLFPLLLSVFVCFSFVVFYICLSSIVFIIPALIINIFYCLYYTLLVLHLFITNLVIDFIITM